MALVELCKKVGKYTDKKTGKEKSYVNFYVRCGDTLIPIEPCFFPDPNNDNRDFGYNGRKEVLKAFAEMLPELPENGKKKAKADAPIVNNTNSSLNDDSISL